MNRLGEGDFRAESAGLEPGELNPYVIKVMAEIGYDVSQNPIDSAFDFYKDGKTFNIVVKVCDQATGQRCPIFPQTLNVIDWSFEDPAALEGSEEEILQATREIRDQILAHVKELIEEYRDYAQSRKTFL